MVYEKDLFVKQLELRGVIQLQAMVSVRKHNRRISADVKEEVLGSNTTGEELGGRTSGEGVGR